LRPPVLCPGCSLIGIGGQGTIKASYERKFTLETIKTNLKAFKMGFAEVKN
jgi:Pyruvate/2-oxoacid:ferredoxin oxidoreductase gamma subunit